MSNQAQKVSFWILDLGFYLTFELWILKFNKDF